MQKGAITGLDDAEGKGFNPYLMGFAKSVQVFDVKEPVERIFTTKNVFQIWANQVHLHPESGLTITHLINLFPDHHERLKIYDLCMNEKGQVIKNKDKYQEYN